MTGVQMDAGIHAGNITAGGLWTIVDPLRFRSHRRDQCSGRMPIPAWIGD